MQQPTTARRVLDRGALVCPCCPAGQPVLAQIEQGHGFEIQLAVWVGFGGHGHAVEEVGQDRVAGSGRTRRRDRLSGRLHWAVAALRHGGGGGRVVIDVGGGRLGFSGQIFSLPA